MGPSKKKSTMIKAATAFLLRLVMANTRLVNTIETRKQRRRMIRGGANKQTAAKTNLPNAKDASATRR